MAGRRWFARDAVASLGWLFLLVLAIEGCGGVLAADSAAAMEPNAAVACGEEEGCYRPLSDVIWGFLVTLLALTMGRREISESPWSRCKSDSGHDACWCMYSTSRPWTDCWQLIAVCFIVVDLSQKGVPEFADYQLLMAQISVFFTAAMVEVSRQNPCLLWYYGVCIQPLAFTWGRLVMELYQQWQWDWWIRGHSCWREWGQSNSERPVQKRAIQWWMNQVICLERGVLRRKWSQVFAKVWWIEVLAWQFGICSHCYCCAGPGIYICSWISEGKEFEDISPGSYWYGVVFNIILLIKVCLYSTCNRCHRPLVVYVTTDWEREFRNVLVKNDKGRESSKLMILK